MVTTAGATRTYVNEVRISDCRKYEDLADNEGSYMLLEECYNYVNGDKTYCGDLYGVYNDGFFSDKVQAKVTCNSWKHYSAVVTNKKRKTSEDKSRGYAAYSGWAKLDSEGKAIFYAGFHVD